MADTREVAKNFLQKFSGVRLEIMIVLFIVGRPLQNQELEDITDRSDRTVSKSLRQLKSSGYIYRVPGQDGGWMLTQAGRQLPLFGRLDLPAPNPTLPSHAASKIVKITDSDASLVMSCFKHLPAHVCTHEEPNQTKPNRSKTVKITDSGAAPIVNNRPDKSKTVKITDSANCSQTVNQPGSDLPPTVKHLADLLITDCNTSPKFAYLAAQAVADSGDDLRAVELNIYRWLAYCCSDYATGINNPGLFIARKIESAQSCPAWFEPKPTTPQHIRDKIAELTPQEDDDRWIR